MAGGSRAWPVHPNDVGYRRVSACKPYHQSQWLDRPPAWRSDGTVATVARIVQRAFNWAVRQGLIRANPFASVSHRPGEPRRPIAAAVVPLSSRPEPFSP